jgi:hypothetical protein
MLRGGIGIVVGSVEAIAVRRAAQRSSVMYLSGGIDVALTPYRTKKPLPPAAGRWQGIASLYMSFAPG